MHVTAWLSKCCLQLTVWTAQNLGPTLDGTIVSLAMSTIILVLWTLVSPESDPNAWARCVAALPACL